MKIRTACVYQARNKLTGDLYIGTTMRVPKARWRQHVRDAILGKHSCPKFHGAIVKFGEDAFEWSVLATFATRREAMCEERRLISLHKPAYNVFPGFVAYFGRLAGSKRVLCLETGEMFDSVSGAADVLGYAVGTISRACNVAGSKVEGRHFVFSEHEMPVAEREALILSLDETGAQRRRKTERKQEQASLNGRDVLGRSARGPLTNARRVVCLTDGQTYESASAAARAYAVAKSAVIEMCLKRPNRQSVGGKKFAYAE
jgi:predicted GIY-YIG superfamily endonuclease